MFSTMEHIYCIEIILHILEEREKVTILGTICCIKLFTL